MPYELQPHYPLVGGELEIGYAALAADAARASPGVLAIDGPGALDWTRFAAALVAALGSRRVHARQVDVRSRMRTWSEIERRTETATLREDPIFAKVPAGTLAELFASSPDTGPLENNGLTIVFGPGAALARHDVLWYADLPKRLGLRAVEHGRAPNLGQGSGQAGTARRLMFVDWPLEDRHRRALVSRLHRYVDLSAPGQPRSVTGDVLRSSLAALVGGPFRTRPTFLPQPWGGRWARDVLGAVESEPNAGLGYELIAPESGVLFGERERMEVGLELILAEHADELLGQEIARRFAGSFPIRFDYLDTVGGEDLSVHCHPRDTYMREVFGLPYAQDESYYVMVTRPGARIHLGLRDDADLETFREAAERSQSDGAPFAIERFVNALPAELHQLYLIPAGTPHGSGEGNVVLEISATPYVYSLRLYDWMRAGLGGTPRAVQLGHAFANLDPRRRRANVASELVPAATPVRNGAGFTEYALGRHPELFFAVHRLDVDDTAEEETNGRFHVLNLVEGNEVLLRTASGREHRLTYAETIVVPAVVGSYSLVRTGRSPAKIVKAFVA
ncbi:MAG TPA: class I mannose-6-phosphate isomerase [Candidatus Limnocylindria bacterium]|nr:class I mannose-6-phosphate isomerase [Candidatus Limnocylindria bacterium]